MHGLVPHGSIIVEILWRLGLASHAPAECASTGLFALREPDGRLLLADLALAVPVARDGCVIEFLPPRSAARSP